jgi:uncharacterized protein YkwD
MASARDGTRKVRNPWKKGLSGCRSEVLMQKKLLPLLGLFAALATNSLAQNNNYQTQTAVKTGEISGFERSRRVDDKASGVKAAVVVNTSQVERSAFDLINQKRVENGLQPVVWSEELAAIARLHSQNMAEFNFFGHRGLDEKMVSDRADDRGLRKWRAIGENIAFNRGYQDPIGKAVGLWLNSPSHRHNLLDRSWKESAIGVAVTAEGSYYFTQVFLVRK